MYHDIATGIRTYKDPELSEAENRIKTGHYLVETGTDAMSILGNDVNTWVEDHEERLIDDVRVQRFVRVGCGIITLATRRAFDSALQEHYTKEFEQFEKELSEGDAINWDAID